MPNWTKTAIGQSGSKYLHEVISHVNKPVDISVDVWRVKYQMSTVWGTYGYLRGSRQQRNASGAEWCLFPKLIIKMNLYPQSLLNFSLRSPFSFSRKVPIPPFCYCSHPSTVLRPAKKKDLWHAFDYNQSSVPLGCPLLVTEQDFRNAFSLNRNWVARKCFQRVTDRTELCSVIITTNATFGKSQCSTSAH